MFDDLRRRLQQRFGRTRAVPEGVPPPAGSAARDIDEGRALLAAGQPVEAFDAFTAAAGSDPDGAADGLAGVARAFELRGQRDAALRAIERAVELRPGDPGLLVTQGTLLTGAGQHEAALDCYEVALALAPGRADVLVASAQALRQVGDPDAALARLRAALEVDPDSTDAWFELAVTLNRLERPEEALDAYRALLERNARHVPALVNRGMLLLEQFGDARGAETAFRTALAIRMETPEAEANLGLALEAQGRFDEAIAGYDRAMQARPDFAEFRWNRALALIGAGQYRKGWPDYELRRSRQGGRTDRVFPCPDWTGEDLDGRTLLVYAEQGIGDEIMFASCIPDVMGGARACVLECSPRLEAMYRRSFPGARVHGAPRDGNRAWLSAFPDISVQCAAGSLPRHVRPDAASFPAHDGYLRTDPSIVAEMAALVGGNGGEFKVGLSWRGGTYASRQRLRSIDPGVLIDAVARPGIRLVSLQHGFGDADAAVAAGRLQVLPDVTHDIDRLAALIDALDLVITVDNSTAHLAGALGRPVWVLLPRPADWRWGSSGASTPWYPSARLFRQQAAGDWRDVVAAIGMQLGRRIEERRH